MEKKLKPYRSPEEAELLRILIIIASRKAAQPQPHQESSHPSITAPDDLSHDSD
jgi:hypothetical protein